MSYATITDVARYLGRAVTATSKPTASDVAGFLGDVAGEIDAALVTRGYPVPVPTTATAAVGMLRGVHAQGAACRALRVTVTGRRETDEAACDAYAAALTALRDGEMLLPGVSLDAARGARVRSGTATARFPDDREY